MLVLKDKAEVLVSNGMVFRSEHRAIEAPSVVRLRYFVKVPFRAQAPLTRRAVFADRKSTRLNSSHSQQSRMPSSA